MLKAIIADDEINICYLISNLIDWDEYGIEIVKICTNGKEAYSSILELNPDIVITDIRMPGYDGLKLVRETKRVDKNVVFILISGHKDFQYAYNAIQYGVEHYMLKPIHKNELIKNIESIKSKISEKKTLSSLEQLTQNSQHRFLKDLVSSSSDIEALSEDKIISDYLLEDKSSYSLALIKPDFRNISREPQKELIMNKISSYFTHTESHDDLNFITYSYNEMILVLISSEEDLTKDRIIDCLTCLRKKIVNFCDISIGIDHICNSYKDIEYNNVLKALSLKIHYGKNRFFFIDDLKQLSLKDIDKSVHLSFRKLIESLNASEVEVWFNENASFFLSDQIDPYQQFHLCESLIEELSILNAKLSHMKESDANIQLEYLKNLMRQLGRREELFDFVQAKTWKIINELIQEKSPGSNHYIKSAKIYIEENYDTDLTLESLSRSISISPNYLSMLFKKEVGMNFNRFLTEVRINKAKYYLTESNMNIYEIAQKVGFNDSRYFSRKFLKIIGLKPTEYRNFFS